MKQTSNKEIFNSLPNVLNLQVQKFKPQIDVKSF